MSAQDESGQWKTKAMAIVATLVLAWTIASTQAEAESWRLAGGPNFPNVIGLSAHPTRPGELLAMGLACILLSTDGGATFQIVAETAGTTGAARFFRDPRDPGFILMYQYMSADAGRSWSRLAGHFEAFAFARSDAELTYAITTSGNQTNQWVESFASPRRGESFVLRGRLATSSTHPPRAFDLSVDAVDSQRLWAVIGNLLGDHWDAHLYTSSDGGVSWSQALGPEEHAVGVACDPLHSGSLYVLATHGLYLSTNAGADWTPLWTTKDSVGVYSGSQDELMVNQDGTGALWIKTGSAILASTDNGATWSKAATPWTDSGIYTYPSLAPVEGFLRRAYASNGKAVAYTEDAGTSWKQCAPPPTPAVLGYVAADPLDAARVYAAECCHGPYFRSTDTGATWSRIDAGVNGIYLHPDDPRHVYALGLFARAGIRESLDGGDSWRDLGDWQVQTGTGGAGHVSAFAFGPDDPRTIIIGAGGYDYFDEGDPNSWGHVFISQNGGATWRRTSFDKPNWAILGVAIKPGDPDTMVVATSNAGIYRTVDGGDSWDLVVPPDGSPGGRHFLSPRMATDRTAPNLIVASTSTLFVSEDFGASWTARAPETHAPVSVAITHPSFGATRLIVPGAGNGVLYFSDDLGLHWTQFQTGINDSIQMVAPTIGGSLWAVTARRGVASGRLPDPPARAKRRPIRR